MVLTKKQEEGLRIAVDRYELGEPWTCIAGYAGTGKTTVVRFIIEALKLDPEQDVCYISYTGKAAAVLQSKGCPNAMTAHKLLYKAKLMPDGGYIFIPVDTIDYKVIVVDEISMLPNVIWEQLLSHHKYVLAMGDPAQLPPVSDRDNNHVLDHPHVFLDEIMRQAQDSEIIRLSMWIRQNHLLKDFNCKNEQVMILENEGLVNELYTWGDQVICATNKTKKSLNDIIRQIKGFGPTPQIGDKLISLHNHWDIVSYPMSMPLINGTIGVLTDFEISSYKLPLYISEKPITCMDSNFRVEDNGYDFFNGISIDYDQLLTGEPSLSGKQIYQIQKNKKIAIKPPIDFSYAYAITCHKAQGSEWDKVLIFEEPYPFEKDLHTRWLYTAITRAREKVVIIKK